MKLPVIKVLSVGTVIVMVFIISACGGDDKKQSKSMQQTDNSLSNFSNADVNNSSLVTEDGKAIFDANCSSCHMQGGNMMAPDKTLSKKDLKKHSKYSEEAIYQLLKEGVKGTAMMSFEHLGEDKLRAVTDYVMRQAETGWSE